jgi:hypothetical protein
MIRFIDLSHEYWTDYTCGSPVCAFLSTNDGKFITTLDGCHTFGCPDSVNEHPQAERLWPLVPKGFFDNPIPREPSEVLREIRETLYGHGFCIEGFHLNGDSEELDCWFEEYEGWL